MACNRVEERVSAAFGVSSLNTPRFEPCYSIPNGGVILLLPYLIECGLLSYRPFYQMRSGYYSFDSLIITLSFFALLRIKSIEQSKNVNQGEMGKLIGYDRIPEVKKLRSMIQELTNAGKCENWGKSLSIKWINEEEPELYYVDGHVQVYHGYLAELGKKFVSRQRLCLAGMTEFWVNSEQGLPFFFITAQVNEKMIEMLENKIIPHLIELHKISDEQQKNMSNNPDYPLFTLVFDREAYSPALFKNLWEKYRIAVLTYRKNVKEDWDEADFEEVKVNVSLGETNMKLHEKEVTLDNYTMREVRRLTSNKHQTSIITNNKILSKSLIACYMFGRWVQENFFRYLRQDYAFDKIIQYATNEIDNTIMVVNREYSNIQYEIKRCREKLNRIKAKIYKLQQESFKKIEEENLKNDTKKVENWFKKTIELTENAQKIEQEIEKLTEKRKKTKYKIPLSDMPKEERYNKLHQESKYLMNIIKMICYRAETALAKELKPHFRRAEDEIRALTKAIINLSVDIEPQLQNSILLITIYQLSNSRSQIALENIIEKVNATNTVFPGTNLIMKFKSATIKIATSQEF